MKSGKTPKYLDGRSPEFAEIMNNYSKHLTEKKKKIVNIQNILAQRNRFARSNVEENYEKEKSPIYEGLDNKAISSRIKLEKLEKRSHHFDKFQMKNIIESLETQGINEEDKEQSGEKKIKLVKIKINSKQIKKEAIEAKKNQVKNIVRRLSIKKNDPVNIELPENKNEDKIFHKVNGMNSQLIRYSMNRNLRKAKKQDFFSSNNTNSINNEEVLNSNHSNRSAYFLKSKMTQFNKTQFSSVNNVINNSEASKILKVIKKQIKVREIISSIQSQEDEILSICRESKKNFENQKIEAQEILKKFEKIKKSKI